MARNPFEALGKAVGTNRDAATVSAEQRTASYKPPPVLPQDPQNPSDGDHWVNSAVPQATNPESRNQIDGTTYKTPMQPATQPSPDSTPIGAVQMYAGAAQPPDPRWLLCDGSVVAQASYPDLFNVVSTSFNTGGESSSQFRLPDLRSAFPLGAGQGAGLTSRTLGAHGGEENHTLTDAELAAHSHGGNTEQAAHAHGGSANQYGHGHNIVGYNSLAGWSTVSPGTQSGSAMSLPTAYQGAGADYHTHTIATDTQAHAHTIDSDGQGTSHNNMPPYVVLSFVIRALP